MPAFLFDDESERFSLMLEKSSLAARPAMAASVKPHSLIPACLGVTAMNLVDVAICCCCCCVDADDIGESKNKKLFEFIQ